VALRSQHLPLANLAPGPSTVTLSTNVSCRTGPSRDARLCCSNLVRIRGERWRVAHYATYDTVAVVEVTGCGLMNWSERTVPAVFELVDRLHSSSSPKPVSRARWRHIARHTLANASPSWNSLRAATHANLTLIPFQLEPAMALVRGDGCRFLIAGGILYAILRARSVRAPSRAEWGRAAIAGLLMLTAGNGLVTAILHAAMAASADRLS
jgi:hypothetical protein